MIERVSTVDAVVQYFRQAIRNGSLGPGDRLPTERALQQGLGVSRFALREGLARLNAMGLLDVGQGRVTRITTDARQMALSDLFLPLFHQENPGLLDDLVAARSLLECEFAALVAGQHTGGQLAELEDQLRQLKDAVGEVGQFGRCDYAFHRLLARMVNNLFLERMHELLAGQVEAFLLDLSQCRDAHRTILEEHRQIVERIAAGDEAGARRVMQAHLQQCKGSYRRQPRESGSSGIQ